MGEANDEIAKLRREPQSATSVGMSGYAGSDYILTELTEEITRLRKEQRKARAGEEARIVSEQAVREAKQFERQRAAFASEAKLNVAFTSDERIRCEKELHLLRNQLTNATGIYDELAGLRKKLQPPALEDDGMQEVTIVSKGVKLHVH